MTKFAKMWRSVKAKFRRHLHVENLARDNWTMTNNNNTEHTKTRETFNRSDHSSPPATPPTTSTANHHPGGKEANGIQPRSVLKSRPLLKNPEMIAVSAAYSTGSIASEHPSNFILTQQSSPSSSPNGKSVSAHRQSSVRSPTDPPLQETYQKLMDQCREHEEFFRDDPTEKGQRLCAAFGAWQDFIVKANELTLQINGFAHKYDFDVCTQGNGYRSFVTVTNACVDHGLTICQNLLSTRSTMFFRKKFYMKEVEACSQLLSSLSTCLEYLVILHDWSHDSGDLFANGKHSAEELFEMGDTINQYCFYGRCLGFQYGDSIRGVLRFISIGMASFSESFYSEPDGPLVKTTRSIWTGGKYFMNPELRARRIVNISQNAKIDFCKSFWFLAESELMHRIPAIVGSAIKVNRVVDIPTAPLQLPRAAKSNANSGAPSGPDENQNDNGEDFVDIPVPSAHLGPGLPVTARLLSYTRRKDMLGEGVFRNSRKMADPSRCILFHLHGGGFVAQSSKSHELYLRDWAVALDIPILSVDYSLAPEAPFPRALEEAFYAYCWMLKNAEHLGTTAERVVIAGDSAGANLSIGVALKCIEQNVRIPDGLFLAYCPTLIQFVPSPARLLCLMDPLLPFGFMMRCLRAYAAPDADVLAENIARVEEKADVLNAGSQDPRYSLHLERDQSASSSRRTSAAKSPLSSVAENSKWDQMKGQSNGLGMPQSDSDVEDSSDTFASASYRSESQTVERTDLPDTEDDNSSAVSFEDDSQPIVHYPVHNNPEKSSDSEKYIDNFLDKYCPNTPLQAEEATECPTDRPVANGKGPMTTALPAISPTSPKLKHLEMTKAKTASEENLLIDTGREMIGVDKLQERFNYAVNSISTTFNRYTKSTEIRGDATPRHFMKNLRNMDALIARSPSMEFAFNVPRDPFLSPYWASDEWLSQMPMTRILTLDMDPCLDDCVMFAKKLKSLGRPVDLDILKGLPHGFLNFTMISNEAMDGSKRCIEHLKDLLRIPEDPETHGTPVVSAEKL